MVRPNIGTLQDAVRHAEALANSGVNTSHALALVKTRNELIRLEKAAEEARKEVIEPALDEEMDVGDRVDNVQRLEAERSTVTDNAAALEMLKDANVDPAEVVTVHPGQFAEAVEEGGLDPSKVLDSEKYTYYRRDL